MTYTLNSVNKLIGKYIKQYLVIDLIGIGGMGVVFKVKDEYNQIYALKIMNSNLHDHNALKRFDNEILIMMSLNHDSIVKVYDYGYTDNGEPFLVMEYVSGIPLSNYIKIHKRSHWLYTLKICLQISKALEYSHSCGVIHRDIKPSNIILLPDDKIKITDFGLAKLRDTSMHTDINSILGTPRYMSPEQWRISEDSIVTEKTDYYSLGVLMYEMIVGETIWGDVESIQIFRNIASNKNIQKPSELIINVPEFIDEIILNMLNIDYKLREIFPISDIEELMDNPDRITNIFIEEVIIPEIPNHLKIDIQENSNIIIMIFKNMFTGENKKYYILSLLFGIIIFILSILVISDIIQF